MVRESGGACLYLYVLVLARLYIFNFDTVRLGSRGHGTTDLLPHRRGRKPISSPKNTPSSLTRLSETGRVSKPQPRHLSESAFTILPTLKHQMKLIHQPTISDLLLVANNQLRNSMPCLDANLQLVLAVW